MTTSETEQHKASKEDVSTNPTSHKIVAWFEIKQRKPPMGSTFYM